MPDPEKLLNTVRKAIDLTRRSPGRSGRVLHVPGDDEVMVVGDLHGNIANFQSVLHIADLARQPRRHLVMQELIHGKFHYADGSDKSHQAVDLWCALKFQYPHRVHYLPGNHELAQATNRPIAKADTDLNANFRDGVRSAYGKRADEVYQAYLELFLALPLAIRTPNRVFISHTIPPAAALLKFDATRLDAADHDPAELAAGGLVYGMVWGRDVSAENARGFLRMVDADWLITGHVPCEAGFAVPNDRQIILDSLGAAAGYCVFQAGGLRRRDSVRAAISQPDDSKP